MLVLHHTTRLSHDRISSSFSFIVFLTQENVVNVAALGRMLPPRVLGFFIT